MQPYTTADFTINPLMLYYETTRACDLVCKHCRAEAQHDPHPDELNHEQSLALIRQAAEFPRKPNMCFTGGDPLKRSDIFEMIRLAVSLGITAALTPSATPLATHEAFKQAKQAGVHAIGISLDGATQEMHDAFRGWEGSFEKTKQMLAYARELNLPVQVNTSLCQRNFSQLDLIAQFLKDEGIAMWSVFFLIPVGRGIEEPRLSPIQYKEAFEKLHNYSLTMPYGVKTTEAPHYRRFVLELGDNPLAPPREGHGGRGKAYAAPLGITDGRGIMFVGHNGEIFPAGFLPLCCGKFPQQSIIETYQNHPTFKALQNPDNYKGKCRECTYRFQCGGSRARAFALTGDPLETEPDCFY